MATIPLEACNLYPTKHYKKTTFDLPKYVQWWKTTTERHNFCQSLEGINCNAGIQLTAPELTAHAVTKCAIFVHTISHVNWSSKVIILTLSKIHVKDYEIDISLRTNSRNYFQFLKPHQTFTCIVSFKTLTLSHLQKHSDEFVADDFWKYCGNYVFNSI